MGCSPKEMVSELTVSFMCVAHSVQRALELLLRPREHDRRVCRDRGRGIRLHQVESGIIISI